MEDKKEELKKKFEDWYFKTSTYTEGIGDVFDFFWEEIETLNLINEMNIDNNAKLESKLKAQQNLIEAAERVINEGAGLTNYVQHESAIKRFDKAFQQYKTFKSQS